MAGVRQSSSAPGDRSIDLAGVKYLSTVQSTIAVQITESWESVLCISSGIFSESPNLTSQMARRVSRLQQADAPGHPGDPPPPRHRITDSVAAQDFFIYSVDMNTTTVESFSQYINGDEDLGTVDADLTRRRSTSPLPFLTCVPPASSLKEEEGCRMNRVCQLHRTSYYLMVRQERLMSCLSTN